MDQTKNKEEVIDIEQFTKEGKKPPQGKHYEIRVGDHMFRINDQFPSCLDIMLIAGVKHPECFWLYEKKKGCDFERVAEDEKVNLAKGGIEHFVLKPTEVLSYFVDEEPETTDKKELTPNQILEAAGIKPVKDYYLVKIHPDGTQESFAANPNTPIKMVCPAVKFVSVFRGETPVS